MTTVGYGDITAQNPGEVAYTILLLLIAAIIFPGIVSMVTDIMDTLSAQRKEMTKKMTELGKYMHWRNVPHQTFMGIRSHLQYLWETNQGYDEYEDELKEKLPPTLRNELCYHIYGDTLRHAPFLSWLKDLDVCVKQLSMLVDNLFLSQGDVVFYMGQPNEQVYILIQGAVRISLNESLFAARLQDCEKYEGDEILSEVSEDDIPEHDFETRKGLRKLRDFALKFIPLKKP